MALDLIFEGVSFPRARIKSTELGLVRDVDGTERLRDDRPPIFSISSQHVPEGRPWVTDIAQAFWFDFSRLDLKDEGEVLKFVRRRGLVFAQDGAWQETTELWRDLQLSLSLVGRNAWEQSEENGPWEIKNEQARKIAAVNHTNDPPGTRLLKDLKSVPNPSLDGAAFIPKAPTLASYMMASAMIGLQDRLPMKACEWCGSHFYRLRSDARFCSPSCRARWNERSKPAAE